MIAGLAVADLTAVCAELAGMSVPGDSLAWINGCDVLGHRVLADLVRVGRDAGMAVVLGTASGDTADRLAAGVNVLVADGPVDQALVGAFTGGNRADGNWASGTLAAGHTTNGWPGPATEGLLALAPAAANGFALLAREPRPRMLPQCQHVPVRDGGWRGAALRPGRGAGSGDGGRPG
jgi:hypothetical protein